MTEEFVELVGPLLITHDCLVVGGVSLFPFIFIFYSTILFYYFILIYSLAAVAYFV